MSRPLHPQSVASITDFGRTSPRSPAIVRQRRRGRFPPRADRRLRCPRTTEVHAAVAQLVERPPCKRTVRGSSPLSGSDGTSGNAPAHPVTRRDPSHFRSQLGLQKYPFNWSATSRRSSSVTCIYRSFSRIDDQPMGSWTARSDTRSSMQTVKLAGRHNVGDMLTVRDDRARSRRVRRAARRRSRTPGHRLPRRRTRSLAARSSSPFCCPVTKGPLPIGRGLSLATELQPPIGIPGESTRTV